MRRGRAALVLVTLLALGAPLAWLSLPSLRFLVYRSLIVTGTPALRAWSFDGLVSLGEEGIDELAAIATDEAEDAELRAEAFAVLGELGERARVAAPRLLDALKVRALPIRAAAHDLLLGLKTREVSPEGWMRELQSGAEPERAIAALHLGEIYTPAPAIARALAGALVEGPQRTRIAALRALGALGRSALLALPELLALLENEDEDLRWLATEAIRGIFRVRWIGRDKAARQVASPVLKRLADPDDRVRESAARILDRLPVTDRSVVLALRRATADPALRVRIAAAIALAGIAPGSELTPLLVQGLGEGELHSDALSAISALGPAAADAVPALRAELARPHPPAYNLLFLLSVLAKIGPRASAALPDMLRVLDASIEGSVNETHGGEVNLYLPQMLWSVGPDERVCAALQERLKDRDPNARCTAARGFAPLRGKRARAATADLILALQDSDEELRESAVEALRGLGRSAARAVPELRRLASSSEESLAIRMVAIAALRDLGSAAADAEPVLSAALKDPRLRFDAALGLVRVAPRRAPRLLGVLFDELGREEEGDIGARYRDRSVPFLAVLRELGAGRVMPLLLQRARSVAGGADPLLLAAFLAFETPPVELAPGLVELLSHDDKELRFAAAECLRRIGPPAQAAAPVLEAWLEDSDAHVRSRAAVSLAFLSEPGARRRVSIPEGVEPEQLALIALARLRQFGAEARGAAAELLRVLREVEASPPPAALSRLGAGAQLLVSALSVELARSDGKRRAQLLDWLAAIGPEARAAAPVLPPLIGDAKLEVQRSALRALAAIGEPAPGAIPAAKRWIEDAELAGEAALALWSLDSSQSSQVTAGLLRAQRGGSWLAVSHLNAALAERGAASARLVPAFAEALEGPDSGLRWSAAELLFTLGPRGAGAAAALGRALAVEGSADVRLALIAAIGGLEGAVPEAVSPLVSCLEDNDEAVRLAAARVLARAGAGDRRAEAALRALSERR